ncbi:PfkB family carbohydrate kinase [Pseudonocardia humida]|uniref:Bifunctional hydroxymethylpyrimidine kinase/phosphomethylpyrimidine kinase n=1 Tax=Pseudonocardia humida TaxID=2800819 RepID=A0ABT0ZV28_9PSEU|nr:PfkB family carbohydrate kinase [Pseudonocardia humida]MCO1654568.1 bifunctional hydroxymethylpyrimidine kinase/phosphomethylpyrimidine kinase [Pseudonocardia humida]
MSARPVVVVGDALLDVDVVGKVRGTSPDAGVPVLDVADETDRPGGAALAAALLAARGVPVTLVTALDGDGGGTRLRELLEPALRLVAAPATGGTPVKRRWFDGDRPLLRTDTGSGRPTAEGFAPAGLADALAGAGAVLVSDYGRGMTADPSVRDALARAVERGTPVVWDPHPQGAPPVPGVAVATPNLAEARRAAGHSTGSASGTGGALLERWACVAVAVTVGAEGAVLVRAGLDPHPVPAPAVAHGDPCGAGDAFAGALAARLGAAAPLPDALRSANEVAARFVADGGARSVAWRDGAWRQVSMQV